MAQYPRKDTPKALVAFKRAVYSMDHDIGGRSKRSADVLDKHGAMTYLDEVHAVGIVRSAWRRRGGA